MFRQGSFLPSSQAKHHPQLYKQHIPVLSSAGPLYSSYTLVFFFKKCAFMVIMPQILCDLDFFYNLYIIYIKRQRKKCFQNYIMYYIITPVEIIFYSKCGQLIVIKYLLCTTPFSQVFIHNSFNLHNNLLRHMVFSFQKNV